MMPTGTRAFVLACCPIRGTGFNRTTRIPAPRSAAGTNPVCGSAGAEIRHPAKKAPAGRF